MKNCVLFLVLIILTVACTSDGPEAVAPGQFQLVFDNVAGDQDLQLGVGNYVNASKEPFTVTTLNYYVTNIRLIRADGSQYVVPQDSSYFLVRETDPATQRITLRDVPSGNYTGVNYLIGVDSVRNTMGIDRRKGVLDPGGGHTGGMYWDWNSGYIHLKIEGKSPRSADGSFLYHIGLFGGYNARTINNLRTVSLTFDQPAKVSATQFPRIQIKADILRIFDGPNPLSIAEHPLIMVSLLSAGVATNYASMFRYVSQTVTSP